MWAVFLTFFKKIVAIVVDCIESSVKAMTHKMAAQLVANVTHTHTSGHTIEQTIDTHQSPVGVEEGDGCVCVCLCHRGRWKREPASTIELFIQHCLVIDRQRRTKTATTSGQKPAQQSIAIRFRPCQSNRLFPSDDPPQLYHPLRIFSIKEFLENSDCCCCCYCCWRTLSFV